VSNYLELIHFCCELLLKKNIPVKKKKELSEGSCDTENCAEKSA